MGLTHVDVKGAAKMVDISAKKLSRREAVATGCIHLQPETLQLIKQNMIKKGDVISVARIGGISGAKQTSWLIPLCHNIPINRIDIDFEIRPDKIIITGRAICEAKTGIEMEALTAVSIAALTIYDMCKAVDKKMVISEISLKEKSKYEI